MQILCKVKKMEVTHIHDSRLCGYLYVEHNGKLYKVLTSLMPSQLSADFTNGALVKDMYLTDEIKEEEKGCGYCLGGEEQIVYKMIHPEIHPNDKDEEIRANFCPVCSAKIR